MDVQFASLENFKNLKKLLSKPLLTLGFLVFFLYPFFSWLIEVDYNAKIEITFHDFDLEFSKTCLPYDFVKVSDMCDKEKKWSENIGSGDDAEGYCGNRTSFPVQTRCKRARVEFRSDDSITGRGFNATYKVIPVPSEWKVYYYLTFYRALPLPPPSPSSIRSLPPLLSLLPHFHSCSLLFPSIHRTPPLPPSVPSSSFFSSFSPSLNPPSIHCSIHLVFFIYHWHMRTEQQLIFSRFILGQPEIISFCSNGETNCSTKKDLTETDTEFITCQVLASPEALVYWSYRGLNESNPDGPLDTRERRMTDSHNGTLRIKNLKRNDTGYYRCYANNTQGADDALVYLHVKGKHGLLSNLSCLLPHLWSVKIISVSFLYCMGKCCFH